MLNTRIWAVEGAGYWSKPDSTYVAWKIDMGDTDLIGALAATSFRRGAPGEQRDLTPHELESLVPVLDAHIRAFDLVEIPE